MANWCETCACNGYWHSVTSAHEDIPIDNNGTMMNAFQFGTPTDTTWTFNGQSFEMDVQLTYYDNTPKLSLSTASGTIVIDDPIQRVLHFNVPPSNIQTSLTPGAYVYDLIMLDGSTPPVRVPLMHGRILVGQGITYP